MSETIREMIPEADLAARIAELGAQISKDYEGESVYVICILRGASFFACELAKRITVPVTIDFMTTSSYGSGTVSTGRWTQCPDRGGYHRQRQHSALFTGCI